MKSEKRGIVSLTAVRKANDKLMSKSGRISNVVSDNSKNGDVRFTASYYGKKYQVTITKSEIKQAFKKSLSKTSS